MYLSNSEAKFSSNSKNSDSKDADVLELAEATFRAFRPFINVHDCGKKFTNSDGKSNPIHLITQEACKFYVVWRNLTTDQRKAFKPIYERGSRRGQTFHPWRHYLNCRFRSDMIAEHIRGKETYYYTSGRQRQALIYLDIDAHDGETDELRAMELLQKLYGGRSSLWNSSARGQNGYLKIHYGPISNPSLRHPIFDDLSSEEIAKLRVRISNGLTTEEFNALVDRAQLACQRYLKYYDIECKFELKGKVTEYSRNPIFGTLDIKSGSLAKFPFTGWSWERLKEFKDQMTISWYNWERQIQVLEKKLDEKEQSTVEPSVIEAAANCGTQSPAATDVCGTPAAVEQIPVKKVDDPESCAFRRSHRDCKPFVREFFRKHRRTPTHQEFLAYLKENDLYSGEWDDQNSDRECRTKRVLDFTLQTFDPSLVGKGEGRWGKFPQLKWLRRYATGRFGSMKGTSVKGKNKIIYSEDGLKSGLRIQQCQVPADFVQHCVCVILTCMEDLAENDGLPEERIIKAWELLPNAPTWNRDYYAIVRDHLEIMGVVEIYDKNHRPNKCWRWRKGTNYPSSPKDLKQKLKRIAGEGKDPRTSSFHKDTFIKITPYCVTVVEMERSGELSAQDERPPPSQPP